MTKHRRWALATVVALVACSSGGSSNDGGTDGSSATQACTDLANAICNKLAQCDAPVMTQIWGSTSACATANEASCIASLALTNTSDTPSSAEACSAAYGSLSC